MSSALDAIRELLEPYVEPANMSEEERRRARCERHDRLAAATLMALRNELEEVRQSVERLNAELERETRNRRNG
ncbi:unnamed protein product [Caenorhabditis bovis]|uniref:Uncharacterized protein n=1 Tax=Caenorhabditis bovis TaxID=2654633 RepID=A0A8S1F498_9PELO|nr:unnamed protein product [Caenorhabditis bovis]